MSGPSTPSTPIVDYSRMNLATPRGYTPGSLPTPLLAPITNYEQAVTNANRARRMPPAGQAANLATAQWILRNPKRTLKSAFNNLANEPNTTRNANQSNAKKQKRRGGRTKRSRRMTRRR